MGRPLSPGDDCSEFPDVDGTNLNRFNIVRATDQSFLGDDAETQVTPFSLLADGDDTQVRSTVPKALTGRADIDSAMVEALKSAMASDHGPSGPGWETPNRDQFGGARRSIDLGVSTWGPPELARRCDIDLAMLDALRHAMGAGPEVPDA